jgi:hypothetical protein
MVLIWCDLRHVSSVSFTHANTPRLEVRGFTRNLWATKVFWSSSDEMFLLHINSRLHNTAEWNALENFSVEFVFELQRYEPYRST